MSGGGCGGGSGTPDRLGGLGPVSEIGVSIPHVGIQPVRDFTPTLVDDFPKILVLEFGVFVVFLESQEGTQI